MTSITEEAPAAVTAISVPAAKLREMLGAVLPHAGEEDTLPALVAVKFEVRAGVLFLIATDRYSLAVARYAVTGAKAAPVADVDALLPLAAAEDLHELLDGADGVAAIVFGGDGKLTVDAGGTLSVTFATDGRSKFPEWRRMLAGFLAGPPEHMPDALGLSPLHLAKFTGLLDEEFDRRGNCRGPLKLRLLARSPGYPVAVIAREDWFLGALMPMRVDASPDGGDPFPEWAALLAPAEVTDAAGKAGATA